MLAAAVHFRSAVRQLSGRAVILSAILNLLLVWVLVNEELIWSKLLLQPPEEVVVELVPAPVPPKPSPEKPPAEQAPKPPPSQPAPPKPEEPPAKPQSIPGTLTPPPPPRMMLRPPAPQLLAAPLARQSANPHHDAGNGGGLDAAVHATTVGPALSLAPHQASRGPSAGSGGPEGEALTQSEQDFILSQVLKYWHVDTHVPEARGLVLTATIEIRADGTLTSPLNKDDPWDPEQVISGYRQLVGGGYSYQRQAIEGFLLAIRMSQPLKLPPGEHWPRRMVLRFAFDDL